MTNSKLSVINNDLFDFKEEKTYEVKKFPMATEISTMKLDDFLKIPTFPANRDVESRAKRAANRFVKPMHKHAEVDLLLYTGETTQKPAFFRKGAMYVLDGNTRQYAWKKHYIDNQRVNNAVTSIPVPDEVSVRIYEINDAYEACKLYGIIDSLDAAETKADKITSAFRANNLLDRFTNSKIKKGQIGGALNVVAPYGGKSIVQTPIVPNEKGNDIADIFDQVAVVASELSMMDKLNAPGNGHFHVQVCSGMAMLAGKAMDCNSRWLSIVEELVKFKHKEYDITIFSGNAVKALCEGNVSNPVDIHNALPYDIGYGQNPAIVLNYLAYCWTCIIDDLTISEVIEEQTIARCYVDLFNRVYFPVEGQ